MDISVIQNRKKFELEANQVRERIKSVMEEFGLTENSVAAGDGSAQSRLNSQISHDKRITLDTILRILTSADISADWLLRGVGSMRPSTEITGAQSVMGDNATVIGQQSAQLSEDFIRSMIAEKDKQISTLLSIIAQRNN